MGISLTEATELTGKSKSTLNRAIKSGDLSAKRSEDGKTYEVEKSELERVYGAFAMVNHGSPKAVNHDEPSEQQGMQQALQAELLELRYEDSKKVHRREIELLQAQIDDLRKDRDDWKTQASNQTLLLKHEQERSEKKSFSWFR